MNDSDSDNDSAYASDSDSDNDSACASDSDCDSKTCCATCRGCTAALKRVQYYRNLQNAGTYHYALHNNFGSFHLWRDNAPCNIFAHLDNYANLDADTRSDPYMLAYVDLYAPENIENEKSENPRFMSFDEYDGAEAVDSTQVSANVRLHIEKNRVYQAHINAENNRTMLSDAKQLASSLAANIVDSDSSVMARRLIQLLNSMVI